ncbi:uncharacterized protein LOC144715752 [Wolffia australiana]
MTFESGSQFKAAVKNYTICNGFNVRFQSYLFPPLPKKQPGRPKHRRRTDVSEAGPGGLRITKKGVQMLCSLCNQGGHNRKTCGNRRLQPACELLTAITSCVGLLKLRRAICLNLIKIGGITDAS